MILTEHFKTEVKDLVFKQDRSWIWANVGWMLHVEMEKDGVKKLQIKILNIYLHREEQEDSDLRVSPVVLEDFEIRVIARYHFFQHITDEPLRPRKLEIDGKYITIKF